MKHPENIATFRWRRESSAALAVQVSELHLVDESDREQDARRLLTEIEQHLTAGHEAYHRGRPQQAIEEYRVAQTILYQLLDSHIPRRVAQRRGVRFPRGKDLFRPLLRAGLELVEVLGVRVAASHFGGVLTRVSETSLKALSAFRAEGVHLADAKVRSASLDSQLAADYLERGQWSRAERTIEHARKQLEGAETDDAKEARGALALTSAAIMIQMRRPEEAKNQLRQAEVAFREAKDLAGQAQVHLNSAALHKQTGNLEAVETSLKRAQRFLDRAGSIAIEDSEEPRPERRTLSSKKTLASGTRGAALRRSRGSTSLSKLQNVVASKGSAVTYRLPGRGTGWMAQAVEGLAQSRERAITKKLTLLLGEKKISVQWTVGAEPPVEELVERYFQEHARTTELSELIGMPGSDSELAVQLPHLYLFIIPLALGDCLHELGDYAAAERQYLIAANYEFLNIAIQAPAIWQKIAENALDWGDEHYKADEFTDALEIYRKVVEPPGASSVVPESAPLYSHANLLKVGQQIKELYEGSIEPDSDALNPEIAAVALEVRARVMQLNAGLDFLGASATFVPIWSFDFLQGVARYMAQQAVQAEREFVRFLDKAEDESMTLLQLKQGKEIAAAERMLALEQREAAEAEVDVFNLGAELAAQRQSDAETDKDEFEAMTNSRIEYDAKINKETHGDDSFVHVQAQWRDWLVLEYELAARERQIGQLEKAKEVALAQLKSAAARLDVAEQMEVVAGLKYKAANQQLAAFNHQFFTPDVWRKMALFMRSISRRYLYMATSSARMMQKAYNFEFDQNRQTIRTDYMSLAVKGMLGADLLMLDIDSFTGHLLTVVRRKEIPVKQSISLASSFPFRFESQFKNTGLMEFETRLLDFDIDYPGTYARRLNRVELEIDGIIPEGGIHGTLSNAGISMFRTASGALKFRIQSRDTLLLSEYRLRNDSLVFPSDGKTLDLFEGAGVASTWTLQIPKSSNDLDYLSITDIRMVFYYSAFYDLQLKHQVSEEVAAMPGAFARARKFPLRFTHPDAFYHFLDTGELAFDLSEEDYPAHQTQPALRHVSVKVATDKQTDASGWIIRLSVPDHPEAVGATLDANGMASAGAQHPWEPLAQGSATGEFRLELRADENPDVERASIDDLLLLLEYDYTPQGD